jgi:hypothetical protein
VAVQDELGGGLVELVEDRQDRAAGVAEHRVDLVVVDQHFMQDPTTRLALVLGGAEAGLEVTLAASLCRVLMTISLKCSGG